MAKLIAALVAAAVMIVIIFVMVNFFLRLIGGGLISSLSDAALPLETMTVADALPWDNINEGTPRSDDAYDNAGEIASDSWDDNVIDDTDDDDEDEEVEEVPLYDPDVVFPDDEDDEEESDDTDQNGWNESHVDEDD